MALEVQVLSCRRTINRQTLTRKGEQDMHITQILTASKRRRGYVLITMAAGMVGLLGFAGLVVDVGYMEYYKRKAQTAADAGAQGGVAEINQGRPNTVNQAVTADVATNGFTDGVNGASVVVNNPPLSGGFVGNSKYVEV